jgi:hypothetical protein
VYVLYYVPNAGITTSAANSSLPDLPPAAVTEECCAIQMSACSRITCHWVFVAQTNAMTDPTSQCLDPHTNGMTDPTSRCFNRHKRETLISEYFPFANLVMLHLRIPYFFLCKHGQRHHCQDCFFIHVAHAAAHKQLPVCIWLTEIINYCYIPMLLLQIIGTVSSPLHLGGPNNVCPHCGALFWTEERVRGRGSQRMPIYNKCCRAGRIVLAPYRTPPEPLLGLLTSRDSKLSNHFFDGIRCYNSIFAMTSMGVHVINYINDDRGPYVFKISGQLCHRIGSLMPSGGKRPEYCQLYIFDNENEVRNRMAVFSHENGTFRPNEAIVASLLTMFDSHNPVVQAFRIARDRLLNETDDRCSLRIFRSPNQRGNVYSAPVAAEIVGLVINDLGLSDEGRDLVV